MVWTECGHVISYSKENSFKTPVLVINGNFFLPINLSIDSFEFLATILHVINIPNRSIKGLQPLMVVHEVPAETHGPADGQ